MALGNQRKMLIRQPLGAGPALGALVLGLSPPLSLRFCPAGLGGVSERGCLRLGPVSALAPRGLCLTHWSSENDFMCF